MSLVAADLPATGSGTAAAPLVSFTAGTQTHDKGPTSDVVGESLLDLTAENQSIASGHRLHPNTRTSVLKAVDSWFEGVREPPSASRVMVILGPAGSGKTCLSAELCRRYSDRQQLLARHFFHWRAGNPDHNRAAGVLLGLAYQMSKLVDGYVLGILG